MGTNRKRLAWRIAFLGVTATALVMELWGALDGNPDTDPWTDLIGDYVPWQLALAVFGALLLWVPAHFYVRFRKEAAEHKATQASLRTANRLVAYYKDAAEPWDIKSPTKKDLDELGY